MAQTVVVQKGGSWLICRQPVRVVETHCVDEVVPLLHEIEALVNRYGWIAAGFVSYEAARAFDSSLVTHDSAETPLLWFGLYADVLETPDLPLDDGNYAIGERHPAVDGATFELQIAQIKQQIASGATYQVNYTFPVQATFRGSVFALFRDMTAAQQGQLGAFVDMERFAICSASPELFFKLDGERIATQPMKGTVARGMTLAEDRAQMDWLAASEKNRAENVMIVDMIRNDLGRVARTGSVQVDRLFEVTRYPTLHQMTSTVSAETTASITDIFGALFPCASITGAPKVRTMEIINALETQTRGVYTGAIGFIAPNRQAQFNVAIRTVTIDRECELATYNVGSGIVWDSEAASEYEECRLKAQVLTVRQPVFDLLESLLFTPDEGLFLLDRHVQRMADSAEYFARPCNPALLRQKLLQATNGLSTRAKVRVLLAASGAIEIEINPLTATRYPDQLRVALAAESVASDNPFLYHKTTFRPMYTSARATRPDCDDVILWNERGELTEFTVGNLVVERDGVMVTPPITSGLLSGTLRAQLLSENRLQERILTPDDLDRATKVWMINSVRKWTPCTLVAA